MNKTLPTGSRQTSAGQPNPPAARLAEADLPSRRVVLRGALAAGCSLLLPAALLGCESKDKDVTGAAPAPADSMPPAPAPEQAAPANPAPDIQTAAPAESAKASQASVQYQLQPKGEQKCANCMHFVAESNTCKLVEGEISPEAWCVLWAKTA